MDEAARYNRERWTALAAADALYTRPRPGLNLDTARALADPDRMMGELRGARVLCLCGGGGKQSAAYGLLGAEVTVADLSPEQLERDRRMADHYGIEVRTVEADMRDLSMFEPASFDIVDHAYSINFVPDCRGVIGGVARVLRRGGRYRLTIANPFGMAVRETDWNGEGYTIRGPYTDGAKITYDDQEWVYERAPGTEIPRPVEYRHNLSTVINGLAESGFIIEHFSDSLDMHPDPQAEPGTWDHYVAFVPPWLTFLTRLEN